MWTARLTSDVFDCEIPSSNRNEWLAHFALRPPRWRDEEREALFQRIPSRNRAKRRTLENPPRIQFTYKMLR